ncbi:hypothetical protein [Hanstruepera marina]|uniref:hypothetical protein n=1 Tax=Hanstruepera marina TaxID=2873265 RepID=UPI001CA67282|nr:hypothetical protein [Hanstruepera marina]
MNSQSISKKAYERDLLRIEQAYILLEKHAKKIWDNWNGYKELPFHLKYPNFSLLINHPNPLKDYKPIKLSNPLFKLYLKQNDETVLNKNQNYRYAGALSQLGSLNDRPIHVVNFDLTPVGEKKESYGRESGTAEYQIMTIIHEFFHDHQNKTSKIEFTNPEIVEPNVDFLTYSNIEGLALHKALKEHNDDNFKTYVSDFILARQLKRASMTQEQIKGESEQEINEGLPQYTMYKILDFMSADDKFIIDKNSDTSFNYFIDKNEFIESFYTELLNESKEVFNVSTKKYFYGAAQAFILDRLSPKWRKTFYQDSIFLDKKISLECQVKDKGFKNRLETVYEIDNIRRYYKNQFKKRDSLFEVFEKQKGKELILDFRNIAPFLKIDSKKISYPLGISTLYPNGLDTLEIGSNNYLTTKNSIMKVRFSYLRAIIDEKKLEIKYKRKVENILYDGEILSDVLHFLFKKVEIKNTDNFMKISVIN